MFRNLRWITLGVFIGLSVGVILALAAATNLDRLVLGSDNYGTDPNPTADITLQYDEYITNATDGTIDFGAADLITTGTFTYGAGAHKEYTDTVTLTAAQVKLLYTTPITLIAAPGAGYAIQFLDALLFLDHGGTDYTGVAAGEDLTISYTNAAGEAVALIETDPFMIASADAWRYCTPSGSADNADNAYIIPVANALLCIHMLVGNIATGDSPLKLAIHYKVVPTVL